jgi:hypothetical protein
MKFNHEKAQEMMNFLLEKDIKYFTKLRKTFELKLPKDLNTNEVAKVLEPMREEDKMVALELLYRGIGCNDNVFDKLYSQLETSCDYLSTDDSFDINAYKNNIKTNTVLFSDKNAELKESILGSIKILKTIKDVPTYEHIMAKVLEIYTKQLSYTNTVNEICEEVKGIKQNQLVFNALFNLSETMAGCNNHITSSNKEESEIDVAGYVYDFTIEHI